MKLKLFKDDPFPTKEIIYNFISNLILLVITLWIGSYYINKELQEISRYKAEQQDLINEKTVFVKNFTKLGQSRIYLAENYYKNYQTKEKQDVLDRSWQDYMQAVKSWNEENLVNPIFIKLYFGDEIQNEFYNNLLPKLVSLHESLLNLRDNKNINGVGIFLEDAKHELFIFSERMIFQ